MMKQPPLGGCLVVDVWEYGVVRHRDIRDTNV